MAENIKQTVEARAQELLDPIVAGEGLELLEHPEPYHPIINYIVRHAIHAQEIVT